MLKQGAGARDGWYPESALAGALVAGDAVNPEDVAAGVDLQEVVLGRRPEIDLREIEPARARPIPINPRNKINHTPRRAS